MRIDSDVNGTIGTPSSVHDMEVAAGAYSEIDTGEAQFLTEQVRKRHL